MKPHPKPNQNPQETRTLKVVTTSRTFLYKSRSLENCTDAVMRLFPADDFRVYSEFDKEIFDSTNLKRQ